MLTAENCIDAEAIVARIESAKSVWSDYLGRHRFARGGYTGTFFYVFLRERRSLNDFGQIRFVSCVVLRHDGAEGSLVLIIAVLKNIEVIDGVNEVLKCAWRSFGEVRIIWWAIVQVVEME